jgi:acyl-CoA dehydrogenase
MVLLNPKKHERPYSDERSREVMLKIIEFFESKGKDRVLEDYYSREWYSDFIDFIGKEGVFATMVTPAQYGDEDARWDTWRICEFAEILGFYGLQYWYTWQVSVLGLGPIWMTENEDVKQRAAKLIKDGGIFAFALSEREHGADIYSTDMIVTEHGDGRYTASGSKYYIGNANKAGMVSTFGRVAETNEYIFFVSDPNHDNYHLVKNVVASQSYVAEFSLKDYPLTDADIMARGQAAWDMALNTVNIGKYNLGWASIGICSHAFYEAINHAANRRLYNMYVTDFSHVQRLFVDAYTRLVAMKLFALRAADYMRAASLEDRRYLLFNPMVKMKVTTQGEDVINLMWDVIAAKGFEKDMYFTQAAIDIRALPKLEGTVHVNVALILKFLPNYFFAPKVFPELPKQSQPVNDDFLFNQGPTKGLSKIQFHDYNIAYNSFSTPNVDLFKEQIATYKEMMGFCQPSKAQMKDVDFLLSGGEIFALIVYGQLILENVKEYNIDLQTLDQIFDFMVRDFSKHALELHGKSSTTSKQADYCLKMIRKPVFDKQRAEKVWQDVHSFKGRYEMNR